MKRGSREDVLRLVDALGGNLPTHEAAVRLATHAAVWKSEHDASAPEWTRELRVDLPTQVKLAHEGWLEGAAPQALAYHVSELVYAASADSWGEHLTSGALDTIAEVALLGTSRQLPPGPIYDPAAGVGGSLIRLWSASRGAGRGRELLAQEINTKAATLARVNFYVSGALGEVANDDTLLVDSFESQTVGLAISQPPWGVDWRHAVSNVRAQSAFVGDLPGVNDSQWLFALRMIHKFHTAAQGGGRGLVFLTGRALMGTDSERVRASVLDRDLIDTIVLLPSGLTPNTKVPIYAVVLDSLKPQERTGRIQLVDLRTQFSVRGDKGTSRSLGEGTVDLLRNALEGNRDGPASRVVDSERFTRRRYRVRRAAGDSSFDWTVEIGANDAAEDVLPKRYAGTPVVWDQTPSESCLIDPPALFDDPQGKTAALIREAGWQPSRLSAVILREPSPLPNRRHIPVGTSLIVDDPNAHAESEAESDRLTMQVDPTMVHAGFLNTWLRSDAGRQAVSVARSQFGSPWRDALVPNNRGTLTAFMDALVVPTGQLEVQRSVYRASSDLRRAEHTLRQAELELWNQPDQAASVAARFSNLGDESLSGWTEVLPYPIASALWTLETKPTDEARHKQGLLVLEAYAAYFATVLLSALRHDPGLWSEEFDGLNRALARAHLTLQRPSFGAWVAVSQRLSRVFRGRLKGQGSEDAAQISTLFGGASGSALTKLLDPSVISLLELANSRRNAWAGHSGSLSVAETQDQLSQLLEMLTTLRGLIGASWLELPLVRTGKAAKHGSSFVHDVELLIGARVPFVRSAFAFGEMVDTGDLFIGQDGSAVPLPLLPFFTLQPGPSSDIFTGYFFNRATQDGNARLVAYQTASASELTVPAESLGAVNEFLVLERSTMIKDRYPQSS